MTRSRRFIVGNLRPPIEYRDGAQRDWRDDAACAQVGGDEWFPELGSTNHRAKAVCDGCTVREACLQYALDNNETWGVWGGLSPTERRGLAHGKRTVDARCRKGHDTSSPDSVYGSGECKKCANARRRRYRERGAA